MSIPPPRLLVAVRPDPKVVEALARRLPGVPWEHVRTDPPGPRDAVEALLIGSIARELGAFDPTGTPRLRFVQLIWTGVDGFPFERFPPPIDIAANVGAYAPFVAEHAVALALASARAVVPSQTFVRSHQLRPVPSLRLLGGREAVILGYGEIGREIARRVAGLGMRVVGVNRSGRIGPGCDAMYPADRLREALAEADVIFDVRPLTRATRGSIGAAELAAMRSEGIYVNVGRAATADEESLYRHLVDHPEFRAAFDPWWEEDFAHGTFSTRFPFLDLPNFLGTPHDAGFGPSTDVYALNRALANLARFFRGEPARYLVDRSEYVLAGPPPPAGPR